jgi:hypothetical protein
MTATLSLRLTPDDLMGLEQYARERDAFRARVLEHKAKRTVAVGPHSTWLFEDRLTIQYQVQEMLRAEKIFEPEGIRDELEAYNPLIPDGSNWKVTLLLEYPDPEQRKAALEQLKGIEDRVYVEAAGLRVFAIADEDLERENEEKTSSVHFLRFELGADFRAALGGGAPLVLGAEHAAYQARIEVEPVQRAALLADLSELRRH